MSSASYKYKHSLIEALFPCATNTSKKCSINSTLGFYFKKTKDERSKRHYISMICQKVRVSYKYRDNSVQHVKFSGTWLKAGDKYGRLYGTLASYNWTFTSHTMNHTTTVSTDLFTWWVSCCWSPRMEPDLMHMIEYILSHKIQRYIYVKWNYEKKPSKLLEACKKIHEIVTKWWRLHSSSTGFLPVSNSNKTMP